MLQKTYPCLQSTKGMQNLLEDLQMRYLAQCLPLANLLLDHTPNPREVADPWYTGNFERTWLDVSEGCAALLAEIRKKEGF